MNGRPPCALYLAERFAPSVGGQQVYNRNLHEQFARHLPTVLLKPRLYWPFALHRMVFVPEILATCLRLAKEHRVTHVHVSSARLACTGLLAARLLDAAPSASVHGLDVTLPGKLPTYRWLVPRCLSRYRAVICNSRATMRQAVAVGLDEARCHVVPCGVDPQAHQRWQSRDAARAELAARLGLSLEGRTLGLTVGRLIRRKGVAWFAESVLPLLPPDYIHLVLGQRGPEEARITAAASSRLRVVVNAAEALRDVAYDAADLFVMPNIPVPGHREGFGLVLLEAGMHGLPVVASDLEGIPDAVIPGVSGLLARPADPASFRDAILAVLQWRVRGDDTRAAVMARYSWERVYDAFARILDLPLSAADPASARQPLT